MDQPFEIYNTFGHNYASRRGEFVTQVIQGKRTTLLRGAVSNSTYVLTELTAILNALLNLPAGTAASIYVHNPMVSRALVKGEIQEWERNGWKTRHNRRITHESLWRKIQQETGLRQIQYLSEK